MPQITSYALEDPPNSSPRHGGVGCCQIRRSPENRSCFRYDEREQPVPVVFLIAGQIRKLCQPAVEVGIERLTQERQDFVPKAVAGESAIRVRLVFAPFDLVLAHPCLYFRALHIQQRPNYTLLGNWQDTPQTGEPGASQDTIQYGFSLIGAGVPSRDPVYGSSTDQGLEETLTSAAGGLFEILCRARELRFQKVKRKAESSGNLTDEFSVGPRRFAANAVFDMDHAQVQVPMRRHVAEQVKKADGIEAPGNRHAYAHAGPEHFVSLDGLQNPVHV